MTGQEIVALAIWYAAIAVAVFVFCQVVMMMVDAATLTIASSCAGQGFTNITVEADFIAANISRSSWEIIATGGMA